MSSKETRTFDRPAFPTSVELATHRAFTVREAAMNANVLICFPFRAAGRRRAVVAGM
jgi:hypothetical protein